MSRIELGTSCLVVLAEVVEEELLAQEADGAQHSVALAFVQASHAQLRLDRICR